MKLVLLGSCFSVAISLLFACGGEEDGPATCATDSCNAVFGGGQCDDTTGEVICTCAPGFVGPECRQCAAGYHLGDEGACIEDSGPLCVAGGGTAEVAEPTLRMTLPASWDENWFASPAVVDLDGDGDMEIVAARHSVLYAWDHEGNALWHAAWSFSASDGQEHGGSRMWASPVIGDFDGDGDMELAVGSDADSSSGVNVAVYDHLGELLPGWPQHFGGSDEVRSITAGDLDGDGRFEIVVNKTSAGPTTAVYALDGRLRPGWPQVDHATCDPEPPAEACWDFGGYNQNIGLADLDGDGFLDVVSSYDAIGFGVFDRDGRPFATNDAFADRVVTAVEAYHDLALSQRGWGTGDRSEFTYSPPVLADVDKDGVIEVILAGDHEHSESTENQGNTLWVLRPDLARPPGWEWPKDTEGPLHAGAELGPNIVPTRPSPSVGNLSERAGLEILYPGYDGRLRAYGADGEALWSYAFGTGSSPYTGASEALIADLSGDGVPEVVFTTFTSGQPREPETPAHLVILNNNGALLHAVELFGRGSMAAPTIADVDGDGVLEIVVSLKDTLSGTGGVQIWDVPGATDGCVMWGTGRGGLLRQGRAQ